MKRILTLEIRVKEFQEENLKHEDNLTKLSKLYEMGIIDEDGDLLISNKTLSLQFSI